TGLIHAFWNAVPVNRGGSQPSASSTGLTMTIPKPKPQGTIAPPLASCSLRTASPTSWARCRIAAPAPLRIASPPQPPPAGLACQRLLDERADLGGPALGQQVRPEDRFVGHRPHRQRKRPLTQPVVAAGHADRRHLETLLDRLTRRDRVIGDGRAEHCEAAFVDELAVGVDHRLHRPLRQALYLAEDDLHRAVDQAPL